MKPRKWLLVLVAVALVLSCLPFSGMRAKAESSSEFDVSGSKTASPTELDWNNRETTVTLSLPSAEYQNEVDIVFVTDSSSSTDLGTQFIESATGLFEIHNQQDLAAYGKIPPMRLYKNPTMDILSMM